MISYIIPHKNRLDLFEYNLKSLTLQTDSDFEIIVVDYMSTDDIGSLINKYRDRGLNIRCFVVDYKRCPFSHKGEIYGDIYNPALGQNIGAKQALGDILVFTSPEVINASTNVERIQEKLSNTFTLGWVDEPLKETNITDIIGITGEELKKYRPYNRNETTYARAICRKEHFKYEAYYLGVILRDTFLKLGGMEEEFMAGCAYEDNEFALRCLFNGISIVLDENIVGFHLLHDKTHQKNTPLNENLNHLLWTQKYNVVKQLTANNGHLWGNSSYIMKEL